MAERFARSVPAGCDRCAGLVAMLRHMAGAPGLLVGAGMGQWRAALAELHGCNHSPVGRPAQVDDGDALADELAERRRRGRAAARAEALRQTEERVAGVDGGW